MSTSKPAAVTVIERLRKAANTHRLIRITRGIRGSDALMGHVVAVGPKWTVLTMSDVQTPSDGYACIRTRDIDRVGHRDQHAVVRRLLTSRGQWPPVAPVGAPALDDTATMVRWLAEHSAVLTVWVERDTTDECFVGTAVQWGARAFWMAELDPTGDWDETVSKWRYRNITRVDIGGQYERNLAAAATGAPPAVLTRKDTPVPGT